MTIPQELQKAIINDTTTIKSIEVYYQNGHQFSGVVKNIRLIPFVVLLCKHELKAGESKNDLHPVDFDNAAKVMLVYHNGEIKAFE